MKVSEFIAEDAMMGKMEQSGKIVRILKKAHTVPFSNEKNWLLIDTDPAKGNNGLGIKWIPADTRFEWVRPYRDTVEENFANGKHPEDKGDAKRHGINTKASVSSLRKTAKQGGRKGQLAHWLANMKAGRAKHESVESTDPKKEKLIHDFLKFATKKLQLRSDFTIEFSYDTKAAQDEHHTGAYNFKKNHMTVYSAHRNLIDILRTLCHELVHVKQDQLGQLHHHDAPGSPHEAQADEIAGYLIKLYVKKHHDIIQ